MRRFSDAAVQGSFIGDDDMDFIVGIVGMNPDARSGSPVPAADPSPDALGM
jgi:hypothetical protein